MKTNNIDHFIGTSKGSSVAIIGAMHGNESVGFEVVKELKQVLSMEKISGEIYLIVGNPEAYKQNVRFIDQDLNRLFTKSIIENLSQKSSRQLNLEQQRALEIAPILQNVDYLLDLHSTIKPSIPFVYIQNSIAHLQMAQLFEVEYLVSNSFNGPQNLNLSADSYVDAYGGLGLTYESGWSQSDQFYNVLDKAKLFLKQIGVAFQHLQFNICQKKTRHLQIYKEIIPENDNFVFAKDFHNFSHIKKGEIIAGDGDKMIMASQDSQIIFVKQFIKQGQTAGYLTEEIF